MNYELLISAFHHPDSKHPYRGLFNKRSVSALSNHEDCSIFVFSPVPYAPPIGPYSDFHRIPIYEDFSSYGVLRPRFPYLIPKSILYGASGSLFQRKLVRETTQTPADILHGCHVYPDGYGLSSVAESKEIPFTVMCHGHFLNNFSKLPFGVSKKIKYTLDNSDHIFCVSGDLKDRANKISSNDDVSVLPIGATPEKFPTGDSESLRCKYKIPSNDVLVIFVGQFIERKGVKELIEIVPKLPGNNVHYSFIGHSGELKHEFIQVAERPEAPANIRVLESISTQELREWFAMADLLLLPSHSEGRPTVIYEAMASKTAVLSTQIGGVEEQVKDADTGQLVSAGDPDELLEMLESLVSDSRELERMGIAGYNRLIKKGWTWSNHAERIVTQHKTII